MSRRINMSPEARAREREANRLRMAACRSDPAYVSKVNARRQKRDRERKQQDPDLRKRLTANSKRYYESRKGDPDFWSKRKQYLAHWKAERRMDEEFEDFMNRIEAGDDHEV